MQPMMPPALILGSLVFVSSATAATISSTHYDSANGDVVGDLTETSTPLTGVPQNTRKFQALTPDFLSADLPQFDSSLGTLQSVTFDDSFTFTAPGRLRTGGYSSTEGANQVLSSFGGVIDANGVAFSRNGSGFDATGGPGEFVTVSSTVSNTGGVDGLPSVGDSILQGTGT